MSRPRALVCAWVLRVVAWRGTFVSEPAHERNRNVACRLLCLSSKMASVTGTHVSTRTRTHNTHTRTAHTHANTTLAHTRSGTRTRAQTREFAHAPSSSMPPSFSLWLPLSRTNVQAHALAQSKDETKLCEDFSHALGAQTSTHLNLHAE